MPNYPYINKYPEIVTGVIKMYQRIGSHPLDPTTVFNTKEELDNYVNAPNTYAYPGQIVAVANGNINASSSVDYSIYVIRSDMTIQSIQNSVPFSSRQEAEDYVEANPDTFTPGILFVALEAGDYKLYTISEEGLIIQVTGDTLWDDILDKPTTISGYGITDAASKDLVDYYSKSNIFMNDILLKSNIYSFRFLGIEIFKDATGVNTDIDDGLYVKDNYLNTEYKILNKDDELTKTFQTTPISVNIDMASVYLLCEYEGPGSLSFEIASSTDFGNTWSEWTPLYNDSVTSYPITNTNNQLKLRILLSGRITIIGIGLGVI